LLAVAILLIVGVWLLRKDKTVSTIPSTNPAMAQNQSKIQGSNSSTTGSNSTSYLSTKQNGASANVSLLTPSGTLVSNHRPSLSGTSSPSSEQSVCNTTPGAVCYIEFTKDNEVKKLPAQTTDPTGATFWSWDVKQAGLSVGSWKITAIVTLNGQSKSFTDSLSLEIQP
jgi:hypothetical protein